MTTQRTQRHPEAGTRQGAAIDNSQRSLVSNELKQLLEQGTSFIDLRAPGEFSLGAVPNAVNLPLLTDKERQQIGITFKQSGSDAALSLGHELVSGASRDARIHSWLEFSKQHDGSWLYCWRGGLRSQIAQSWLAAGGVNLPRVSGGFKALRRTCLEILQSAPGSKPWLIIGGRTGSGKTDLLAQHAGSIDLEGLANHRGSAFGAHMTRQPTPIDFENSLAVAYLQHNHRRLLLEDESRTIGRLAIPPSWHAHMQQSPLLILDVELAVRTNNICREYVSEPLAGGVPEAELHSRYSEALQRISKRLGGVRHKQVQAALTQGFANGDHGDWIGLLLRWYYDPMYDYQLEKKLDRVIARGTGPQLLEAINQQN